MPHLKPKDMPNIVDDPLWAELKEIILAFRENRISAVDSSSEIQLREMPHTDVCFRYTVREAYVTSKKESEFIDKIIDTIRY